MRKKQKTQPNFNWQLVSFVGIFDSNDPQASMGVQPEIPATVSLAGGLVYLKDLNEASKNNIFINPHLAGENKTTVGSVREMLSRASAIIYVDTRNKMADEIKGFHQKWSGLKVIKLSAEHVHCKTSQGEQFKGAGITVPGGLVVTVSEAVENAVKITLDDNNHALSDFEKINVRMRLKDLQQKQKEGKDSPRKATARKDKIRAVEYVLYNPEGKTSAVELISEAKSRFPKATSGVVESKVRDLFNDIEKAHKNEVKVSKGPR